MVTAFNTGFASPRADIDLTGETKMSMVDALIEILFIALSICWFAWLNKINDQEVQ